MSRLDEAKLAIMDGPARAKLHEALLAAFPDRVARRRSAAQTRAGKGDAEHSTELFDTLLVGPCGFVAFTGAIRACRCQFGLPWYLQRLWRRLQDY